MKTKEQQELDNLYKDSSEDYQYSWQCWNNK